MCWYKTEGKTSHEVLIPYVFTFAFWCLLTMLYLVIAAISISFAVFSKSSHLNHLATNLTHSLTTLSNNKPTSPSAAAYTHQRSFLPGDSALTFKSEGDADFGLGSMHHQRNIPMVSRNQTLSRRSLAMRALALRLLGYICIPTLCIVSIRSNPIQVVCLF
jgi:hypothetical protein